MSVSVFNFEPVIVLNGFFLLLAIQNNTIVVYFSRFFHAAERKLGVSVWM